MIAAATARVRPDGWRMNSSSLKNRRFSGGASATTSAPSSTYRWNQRPQSIPPRSSQSCTPTKTSSTTTTRCVRGVSQRGRSSGSTPGDDIAVECTRSVAITPADPGAGTDGRTAPAAGAGRYDARMKYRRLGKTGLRVSVIGLGTWQFGGEWGKDFSQDEVTRMLARARDLGVNL